MPTSVESATAPKENCMFAHREGKQATTDTDGEDHTLEWVRFRLSW
jgi:hypothetical protein